MGKRMPRIFLSYSWKNLDVANQIDNDFRRLGLTLIRDIRDAEDFKSIPKFIAREVGKSDYMMMIVSKEYLESRACLYEVIELLKRDNFDKRALPVTLDSGKNIYNPNGRKYYYDFWCDKLNEIQNLIAEHTNSDFVTEKESIQHINNYLVDFLKKLVVIKSKDFKALKEENYHSVFKITKYSQAPLIEELFNIDKIENLEEKKIKLDNFLIRYPRYPEAIFLKGRICSKLKQYTEAKHYYKMVFEIDENHDFALTNYGALLSNVDKKYDEALHYFERSLRANNLNETTYENRGIVYNLKSDHISAIGQFKKVLKINPTNTFALIEVARTYELLRHYERACNAYRAAITFGAKDISAYHDYAKLQRIYLKDFRGAVATLERALEIEKDNYKIRILLALILQEDLKNYEAAIRHFEYATTIQPKDAYAYSRVASINAIEFHNYELAKEWYLKTIKVDPAGDQAYSDLGFLSYEYLNDYSSGKSYLEWALSINENNVETNVRYAWLLHNHLNDKQSAKKYFKRAVLLDPKSEQAHHEYALFMLEMKDDKAALFHFEEAMRINPLNTDAFFNAGAICFNARDYAMATECFLKVIALDFCYPCAHHTLGQIYSMQEKHELAKFHFEQELSVNPNDLNSHISLGTILSNNYNRPGEAKIHFERAIELDGKSFLAHYNLGIVVNDLQGLEAAKPHFIKAKELYDPAQDGPEFLEALNEFIG